MSDIHNCVFCGFNRSQMHFDDWTFAPVHFGRERFTCHGNKSAYKPSTFALIAKKKKLLRWFVEEGIKITWNVLDGRKSPLKQSSVLSRGFLSFSTPAGEPVKYEQRKQRDLDGKKNRQASLNVLAHAKAVSGCLLWALSASWMFQSRVNCVAIVKVHFVINRQSCASWTVHDNMKWGSITLQLCFIFVKLSRCWCHGCAANEIWMALFTLKLSLGTLFWGEQSDGNSDLLMLSSIIRRPDMKKKKTLI